ncbi:hypothetical protein SLS62_001277 [Diatrype stigma]|uniref:DNA mismatch repair protein MutS-like N-terminal domain-containing protein n=1 Tax=Diatrype stigma TaxID=117547 RepID=A0AAN9V1R9_9PEZI
MSPCQSRHCLVGVLTSPAAPFHRASIGNRRNALHHTSARRLGDWQAARRRRVPQRQLLNPALGIQQQQQTRGKKTKSRVRLEDLPQGPIIVEPAASSPSTSPSSGVGAAGAAPDPAKLGEDGDINDEAGPAEKKPEYPTVVLQARRNMRKFDNCVLLTRVGGFYELYFEHAEEYGPLLNIKVAQRKTSAGPVPMVGFAWARLYFFSFSLWLAFS